MKLSSFSISVSKLATITFLLNQETKIKAQTLVWTRKERSDNTKRIKTMIAESIFRPISSARHKRVKFTRANVITGATKTHINKRRNVQLRVHLNSSRSESCVKGQTSRLAIAVWSGVIKTYTNKLTLVALAFAFFFFIFIYTHFSLPARAFIPMNSIAQHAIKGNVEHDLCAPFERHGRLKNDFMKELG